MIFRQAHDVALLLEPGRPAQGQLRVRQPGAEARRRPREEPHAPPELLHFALPESAPQRSQPPCGSGIHGAGAAVAAAAVGTSAVAVAKVSTMDPMHQAAESTCVPQEHHGGSHRVCRCKLSELQLLLSMLQGNAQVLHRHLPLPLRAALDGRRIAYAQELRVELLAHRWVPSLHRVAEHARMANGGVKPAPADAHKGALQHAAGEVLDDRV
mmetsp:Transcript_68919/g.197655  ORF Transcript_68919/g.197655 Transcript_68919/m.197655 type:complete len:212 (+) Transcript_68919:367-1002(+)